MIPQTQQSPAPETNNPRPARSACPENTERAPLKILLVDDEPEFVELIDYVLKKDGFTTMTANSGIEALDLLQKEPADILITDMRMPGITGLELMQSARKNYPWLQAIAVSAHETTEDAIELMKQGAVDFLQKPISNDDLRLAVEAAAGKVRLQRNLKKTTQTLDRIIAGISDAIWSAKVDAQHELTFTFVSPVIETISGRAPEYYQSFESHAFTIHPEDLARVKSAITNLTAGKSARAACEYRILHADGSIRWVQDTITAEHQSGEPVILNGILSDITKRKKTEAMLAQSEQFQKAIIDALPDMVFIQNAHGVYESGHIGDASLFYTSPDQFIGRTAWEVFPNKTAHLLEQARIASSQTNGITTVEYELPVQGEMLYFETRFAPMAPDRTLSIIRNITDRKKTWQALQESEELYRAIVRSSHDAIFIYDGKRIVFANDRLCELTGYSHPELLHTDIRGLIHPEDQHRLVDIAYEYTDTCFLANYVTRLIHKDKGVISCAITVSMTTYHSQCAALGTLRML